MVAPIFVMLSIFPDITPSSDILRPISNLPSVFITLPLVLEIACPAIDKLF